MKPQTILAKFGGDYQVELQVQEFVGYEPSAYQYDSGWVCHDPNTDTDYFVSESGLVYKHGSDTTVGVAPQIIETYQAELETEVSNWHGSD